MQLDVVVAFFLLGVCARLLRTEVRFPQGLHQTLTIFLMLAIGLKGGVALSQFGSWTLLWQALAVVVFGIVLPLLAFPLLHWVGGLQRTDAASIAAHYGSVSVGTYAVAVAFLESRDIVYEAYFPLFVALLEMPAIVVGIALARKGAGEWKLTTVLPEIARSQGLFLMAGAMVIGALAGERAASLDPLFKDLFKGVLALFLLEMGLVAASRFGDLKTSGPFLSAFGVAMPLLGGGLGLLLGQALDLSSGGLVLMAVLGASASYIAVPAAMRVALPDANHGLAITASLGITFPFNVLVGIPVFGVLAQQLAA